jgi:RNA recognition motif-containing protein
VGKKLYVGNLSYSVDNTQLEEMFAKFGAVRSAEVIQDRDTGRSKGFGFVEMGDDNAAREAIEGLNDREQDGRRMTVNEARPKEPRSGGGGGYSDSRGGRGSSAYGRR